MVNSRALPCHPIVDSKLGATASLASMSGRQPTVHHHSLSQPRALPIPGPRARAAPRPPETMPSVRQSTTLDQHPQTARRPHRVHTQSPPTQETARHPRSPPRDAQTPLAVEDAASAAQSTARSRPNHTAPCLETMSLSIARRHRTAPYPCPCHYPPVTSPPTSSPCAPTVPSLDYK